MCVCVRVGVFLCVCLLVVVDEDAANDDFLLVMLYVVIGVGADIVFCLFCC